MKKRTPLILTLLGAMQLAALLPVGFLDLDGFQVDWLRAVMSGIFLEADLPP